MSRDPEGRISEGACPRESGPGGECGLNEADQDPGEEVPVLLYDGACGFCRSWVPRWRRLTGGRIAFLPYQQALNRAPGIPEETLAGAIHFVMPGTGIFAGFEALARSLHIAAPRRWGWLLFCYRRIPGFRFLAEAAYRFLARHRHRIR